MMPLDPHNRLFSRTRMSTQPVLIAHASHISKDLSPLQIPHQRRRVPSPRAIAMLLIRTHPIVVSLPPSRRSILLNIRVLTHTTHRLCVPLRSRARGLQLRQAEETVLVAVTEVEDLVAVAASLCDTVERAARLLEELTATFEEMDDSGIVILTGLCEAALNAALPVCVVVASR